MLVQVFRLIIRFFALMVLRFTAYFTHVASYLKRFFLRRLNIGSILL